MLQYPEQVAIESVKEVLTYKDLSHKVSSYATQLISYGLFPGDRLLVQVGKSPEAVALYLACLKLGVVYAPLNTAYSDSEVLYFISNSEPKIVVCDVNSQEMLEKVVKEIGDLSLVVLENIENSKINALPDCNIVTRKKNDVAVLIYTSGTTGRSKGAMLTHGNLTDNALLLVKLWQFSDKDTLLHSLPIFHIHGLFVALHTSLIAGAKMLWHDKFEAKHVVKKLPEATVFMGVPTYYQRMLREKTLNVDQCRNIRLFISGSAPLTVETAGAFLKLTGHRILERYGMSEAGIITSNPLDGDRLEGTVGVPLKSYKLRIVGDHDKPLKLGEIGSIQIMGPSLFHGYWRMPEKLQTDFSKDGWFKTGDLGFINPKGYLSIVGRSKDMIISGGYNVYPKEIEQLLEKFPQIEEVAVVGVPHHDFGEVAIAIIVEKQGESSNKRQILENLAKNLANYKVPKLIYEVEKLPKNAMGKVQKNLIREKLNSVPEIVAFNENKQTKD